MEWTWADQSSALSPLELPIGKIEMASGKTSAIQIRRLLAAHPDRTVRLDIDSGGGDVGAMWEIADVLQKHRGLVIATAGRVCASAAVIVLAAATRRFATPTSMFLLHEAGINGSSRRLIARDLRGLATALDRETTRMSAFLIDRCGMPRGWLQQRMESAEFFGPSAAMAGGLIHDIIGHPELRPIYGAARRRS